MKKEGFKKYETNCNYNFINKKESIFYVKFCLLIFNFHFSFNFSNKKGSL